MQYYIAKSVTYYSCCFSTVYQHHLLAQQTPSGELCKQFRLNLLCIVRGGSMNMDCHYSLKGGW